jgi:hypothetical protein
MRKSLPRLYRGYRSNPEPSCEPTRFVAFGIMAVTDEYFFRRVGFHDANITFQEINVKTETKTRRKNDGISPFFLIFTADREKIYLRKGKIFLREGKMFPDFSKMIKIKVKILNIKVKKMKIKVKIFKIEVKKIKIKVKIYLIKVKKIKSKVKIFPDKVKIYLKKGKIAKREGEILILRVIWTPGMGEEDHRFAALRVAPTYALSGIAAIF